MSMEQPGVAAASSVSDRTAQATGWQLPTPPGDALPLVRADFEQAARELGCEVAAIRAVSKVESGGRTGFDHLKRPIIRYENHYFKRLTNGRYNISHPDLSNDYKSAGYKRTHNAKGNAYQDQQWNLLQAAFALAPEAAVMSCSWGMFQVMAEHYRDLGWTSVEQFVKDMFFSEGQHLRAFLGFCRANHLVRYLQKHQWASFALRYNGKKYRDHDYDGQLARAYALYKRQG